MRILIYGADIPDDLTPEDIDDDNVPYGFLSGQRACGKLVLGIAIAQQGDEDEEVEIADVPHLDTLAEFEQDEDRVLVPIATSSVPVQYAQAQAAWTALQGLYPSLPAAALFITSDAMVVSEHGIEGADEAEFH